VPPFGGCLPKVIGFTWIVRPIESIRARALSSMAVVIASTLTFGIVGGATFGTELCSSDSVGGASWVWGFAAAPWGAGFTGCACGFAGGGAGAAPAPAELGVAVSVGAGFGGATGTAGLLAGAVVCAFKAP